MSLVAKIRATLAQAGGMPARPLHKYAQEHLVIDDKAIDLAIKEQCLDVFMGPVQWVGMETCNEEQYRRAWEPYSEAQKELYAIEWLMIEVFNGGYEQYFVNSAGDLAPEALKGLHRFGLKDHAENLASAIDALGGDIPYDQDARWDLISEKAPDFDRFTYAHDMAKTPYESTVLKYIDANRHEFYFDGMVRAPT